LSNKVIDSNKAKEIVRNFLAQYHAVLDVKDPMLEDHTWIVDAAVVSFGFNHTKRVRVNSETGKIMGYELPP
jgi:hypothetical protein